MSIRACPFILVVLLIASLNGRAWAQINGLQAENLSSSLIATAGLPTMKGSGAWNGYATTDTLPTVKLTGSYGLGIDNGGWFDLGASVTFKKVTLTAWTSGLTSRLQDATPSVSSLQRASQFGAQYQFGHWAVYGGVGVQYYSVNQSLHITSVTPTLSVERRLKVFKVGMRATNFSSTRGQLEGVVGAVADSQIIDQNVKSSIQSPSEFRIYGSYSYTWKKLSVTPTLAAGLAINTNKAYLAAGNNQTGVNALAAIQLGFADHLFVSVGKRFVQDTKLSPLTFGLQLKLQQLTLLYSSFGFYDFGAQRAHVVGVAISIQ